MPDFRYGPVELYLVGFTREQPDARALRALSDLLATGVVRLLDLLVVRKKDENEVETIELEEGSNPLGLAAEPDPAASGLVSDDDLSELTASMRPGTSAVVLALELTYARDLAVELAQGGGEVLRTERIPAPVVNALIDHYEDLNEPVEGN